MGKQKLKQVLITDRTNFMKSRDYLIRHRKSFIWKSSGSVDKMQYNGKEYINVDIKGSNGRGHHLNKTFLADINAWLEEKGDTLQPCGNNYSEQMFNLQSIEQNLGRCLVVIDINDCYWRTAYKLGYITYKTYIAGKRKKLWKTGRNACIGSLCKSTVILPYIDGVPVKSARRVERTPIEYQYIRNHIITHVYKMFHYLFSLMGNTFIMCLTDCLVTTYDKLEWVERYFMDEGYVVKHKPIEILSLDRENKRVEWKDFEGVKRNDKKQIVKKGVVRYYEYSVKQVIESKMEDTSMLFKSKE